MPKRDKDHRPGDGSTGPKSDAGKERCSRNATTHGARSENHVILPNESAADYEKLLQDYLAEYPPLNDFEKRLVERAAQRAWHLRRCERLHDEAYLNALINNPDPRNWSPEEIRHIDLMLRYRNAADRVWRAAAKDITNLRTNRLATLHLTEKVKRLYFNNLNDGISRPQRQPGAPNRNEVPADSQKTPAEEQETGETDPSEWRRGSGSGREADREGLSQPDRPSS